MVGPWDIIRKIVWHTKYMKTIIVTGASGDIGSVIIQELIAQNHRVIAVLKNKDSLSHSKLPENTPVFFIDLENPNGLISLEKEIGEKIDWIVAAHGYIDPETDLSKQKIENIHATFQINTISLIQITQLFYKKITQGIIFVSSTSGISANGRYAAYSASKAAVNSLATAFARNMSNLKFYSICPGPTAGKMREKLGAQGGQNPKVIAQLASTLINSDPAYKSGDVISLRDEKVEIVSRI
jgi:short-subunit dehydrogenase